MTRWDADGRPAEWVTEVEAEFDTAERDSWEALAEWRAAVCPQCGNLKAICSDPGGIENAGFHVHQAVCYPSAVLAATQRRIERKFKNQQPDMNGMLATDGVLIGVSPYEDDSEDILGLGERSELERQLLAQQAPRE